MKKILCCLLAVLGFFVLESCSEGVIDWNPEYNYNLKLGFGEDGGSQTVKVQSPSFGWDERWLVGIRVVGEDTFYDAKTVSSGCYEVEGDGISASLRGTVLVIDVAPSTSSHSWSIVLEAGEMVSYVSVLQN